MTKEQVDKLLKKYEGGISSYDFVNEIGRHYEITSVTNNSWYISEKDLIINAI